MPYTSTQHQEANILELSSFTGGINSSVPPTQIADNECVDIQNMFFDKVSGRLRTRYPIRKYTATAASTTGIYNMHLWKGSWYVGARDGTFHRYGTSSFTQYGSLSGTMRPCFCPFNDKLVIASGGTLESTSVTTSYYVYPASGAPEAAYVFERYSRLVTAGEPLYPDRIVESNYFTESTWTATDYADIGYRDDTTVIGITEAFEGLYIIFKRGNGGLRTYYCTALSNIAPTSTLATNGHAPRAHAGVVHAMGRVFLMEEHTVSMLVGTDAQGKIIYDPSPGVKISGGFNATSDCHAVLYPRDAQIWFFPDPVSSEAYIYHYYLNAWTRFTFGSRKVYCAYYDPLSDFLYLGCDDGYIYKYDYNCRIYADTEGSYTSRIVTKAMAQGNREMVLKSPRLIWVSLKAGSGTLYVRTSYAQTSTSWGTVTVGAPQDYVFGNTDYVYDTRSGGSNETYVWPETVYEEKKGDYNQPTESFQFDIVLTSGGIIFDRLVAEVSSSRRV